MVSVSLPEEWTSDVDQLMTYKTMCAFYKQLYVWWGMEYRAYAVLHNSELDDAIRRHIQALANEIGLSPFIRVPRCVSRDVDPGELYEQLMESMTRLAEELKNHSGTRMFITGCDIFNVMSLIAHEL